MVANGIASAPANVDPPLGVVNVARSAINCDFDPSCTPSVTDTVSPIPLSGIAGAAVLQSRTFSGASGALAEGLFGYEYRVDLTNAVGIVNIPCVQALRVGFGPVASFQYDGIGPSDQVYVVTSGGGGSIGLSSATAAGDEITFTFTAPVCAGASAGTGAASFFFGLASTRVPTNINAVVQPSGGGSVLVAATAPNLDKCEAGAGFSSASDPCESAICAVDSFCCSTAWDSICVAEVRTVCDSLTCGESDGTCSHSLCAPGAPLVNSCDSTKANCVASICAVDSFCCTTTWDNTCTNEVDSVCHETCD